MTIIPIMSTGAEDGLRAKALIVPCPTIATTMDGPIIAELTTKKRIRGAIVSVVRPDFLDQDKTAVLIKLYDALPDRDRFVSIDHNPALP